MSVINPRIDEILSMLSGKAMRHEPLDNVQGEIAELRAEIDRLRGLAPAPRVTPRDQFRVNLMVASNIQPTDRAKLRTLAHASRIDGKRLKRIYDGEEDPTVSEVHQLAEALSVKVPALLRAVS